MSDSKPFSIRSRLDSFVYAARGIRTMIASQHNAWVHAAATVAVIVLAGVLEVSPIEWTILILAMMAVWTAEALNTAFEFLCDVASPEFHPLVEKAKDVAAGGVLISALGAASLGAVILLPYLTAALSR